MAARLAHKVTKPRAHTPSLACPARVASYSMAVSLAAHYMGVFFVTSLESQISCRYRTPEYVVLGENIHFFRAFSGIRSLDFGITEMVY